MKKHVVSLVLILLLFVVLVGCNGDNSNIKQSDIEKEVSEETLKTTLEPKSETTPEPKPEPTPEFFEETAIEAPTYEEIVDGFDAEIIDSIIEYVSSVSLNGDKFNGKTHYKLQFKLKENKMEDCKKSLEQTLNIELEKLDENYKADYNQVFIMLYSNEYGEYIDILKSMRSIGEKKLASYYFDYIPKPSNGLHLEHENLEFRIIENKAMLHQNYKVDTGSKEKVYEEYESLLKKYRGYNSNSFDWGQEKGVTHSVYLNDNMHLDVLMFDRGEMHLNLQFLSDNFFTSDYVKELSSDLPNSIMSATALDIFQSIQSDNVFKIAGKGNDGGLYNGLFINNVKNPNSFVDEIIKLLGNPEYVEEHEMVYIETDDYFVEINIGSLPNFVMINIEAFDEDSLAKKNKIFDKFPSALFPPFITDIESKYQSQNALIGMDGCLGFSQRQNFDVDLYDEVFKYYTNWIEKNCGEYELDNGASDSNVQLHSIFNDVNLLIEFEKQEFNNEFSVNMNISR